MRARVRTYVRAVRRGQTDRDKEHFRTRARGETKVRVSVAAGKERRRRTRGRVTPECPRFLLSVPSLLSLARSLDPARPHASLTELFLCLPGPSLSPFPSCSISLSFALSLFLSLSADYSPSLEYTISLFSLLPLSSPRTNGAHHLWPCHALRYPARATSVPFDRDEREPLKITCDCSFSRNEDKR